jgi:hypothetical protein
VLFVWKDREGNIKSIEASSWVKRKKCVWSVVGHFLGMEQAEKKEGEKALKQESFKQARRVTESLRKIFLT